MTVNNDNIIEIKGLSKSFGDVKAVDNVSLNVKRGELFAFLGVNGAGKSTTISIMCGRLSDYSGKVLVDGVDIEEDMDTVKRTIGVVFQNSYMDKALSVKENLRYKATLYGITGDAFEKKFTELSELLQLDELAKRCLGKLSGGQKRRVDIARALLHSPKILVLDEPTTGLDPQTRSKVWEVVRKLRAEKGVTVFLTTHYMEEAADADYIVVINKGQVVVSGTPLELKNTYTADYVTLYGAEEEQVKVLGYPYEKIRDAYRVFVPSTAAVTKLITDKPDLFTDYEVTKGKMDDVFLAVTGNKKWGGEM